MAIQNKVLLRKLKKREKKKLKFLQQREEKLKGTVG